MKLISWNVNGLRACLKKRLYGLLYSPGRGYLLSAGRPSSSTTQGRWSWNCRGITSFWNSAEKRAIPGWRSLPEPSPCR